MKTRLIIDENTVYEVDEECLSRRRSEEKESCKEYNIVFDEENNRRHINNRNRNKYNNRF